jgi:asparaginyl-tRNA synthetase
VQKLCLNNSIAMIARWPCNLQQARFYTSLWRTSWAAAPPHCRFPSRTITTITTSSPSSSKSYSIASLLSRELTPPENEVITINGFVRSVRKQKRVAFAALADGSAMQPLQAVLTPAQAEP